MNATKTSESPSKLTVGICAAIPFLLLLCICCIIVCTAERRKQKPLARATVVVPIVLEAELVDMKTVPPLPPI